MRKPDFCICENQDTKLISAFVFATRIVQSLFLNPKFQAFSHLCGSTARFVWDLVGNPEDRFSHNEAQLRLSWRVLLRPNNLGVTMVSTHRQCYKESQSNPWISEKKNTVHNKDLKSVAYKTLVRPQLEYASTVW